MTRIPRQQRATGLKMTDDKNNLLISKKPTFDCKNDIEKRECRKCVNFETNFCEDLIQHIRHGHRREVPDEVIYKCLNCHLVAYSKYLFLYHSFFSPCALTYENERKKRFVCYTVVKLVHSLDFKNGTESVLRKMLQTPNFGCRYFSSRIISDYDLEQDMKKHVTLSQFKYNANPERFKCEQCPYRCERINDFNTHMLRHAKSDDWFECYKCRLKFRLKSGLTRHFKVTGHNQWSKCKQCFLKFKDKSQLGLHISSCHSKPEQIKSINSEQCSLKCKKNCAKCFLKSMEGISKPCEETHPFKCEHCPLKYKQNGHLKSHIKSCHSIPEDIGWFRCAHCPAKFNKKCNLKTHTISRHTKPKDIRWFQCGQCSTKFKRNGDLTRHVTARHRNPEEIAFFHCEQCPMKFQRRSALSNHVTSCHPKPEDVKWFKCEQCTFRFKRTSCFKRHMMTRHAKSEDMRWFECRPVRFEIQTQNQLEQTRENVARLPEASGSDVEMVVEAKEPFEMSC